MRSRLGSDGAKESVRGINRVFDSSENVLIPLRLAYDFAFIKHFL